MRALVATCALAPIVFGFLAHLVEEPVEPPRETAPVVERTTKAFNLAVLLEHARRPTVIPRTKWDATVPASRNLHAYDGDLTRRFTHLVVHHSDFDPAGGPDGILRYHREVSGFADIGYHFVVEPDGRIYEGRDLRYMGAHAGFTREQRRLGYAKDPDYGAIGVVLDGYFEQARPNDAQLRAAFALIEDLRNRFGIPREHVIGHGEVAAALVEGRGLTLGSSATTCPGSALLRVVRKYRALDDSPSG